MNGADAAPAPRDVLIIEGMFCAACAASVEGVIARFPGVREATVNFAAEAAVVEWQNDAPAHDAPGAPGAGAAAPSAPRAATAPQARERALGELLERIGRLGYDARLAGAPATGDPAPRAAAATAGATPTRRRRAERDLGLRLVVAVFFGMWVMLPSVALYLPSGAVGEASARHALALAAGVFALPVVLWSGLPFYRMALGTLRAGVAGVDALVTIGVAGALALSAWSLSRGGSEVYFEVAVALITLQLVARLVDLRVRANAREAVVRLLDVAPPQLTVVDAATGAERRVALRIVKAGMQVRLRPGERAAVDGEVCAGEALVDRSLLSGEARPARITPGARLHAGEQVLDGTLLLRVDAAAGRRRIDALARQVRQLLASKPPWQRVADRLARHVLWLTASVAVAAGLLVVAAGGDAQAGAARALAVFVITCPCALSLAGPLTGLCASAAAADRGIVLRDLNAITTAARPTELFVDKTGTLTCGTPRVTAVEALGSDISRGDVLALAALAEAGSEHPLARAVVAAAQAAGVAVPRAPAGTMQARPGRGVCWSAAAASAGADRGVAAAPATARAAAPTDRAAPPPLPRTVHVGSPAWFGELGLLASDAGAAGAAQGASTGALVARDGVLVGRIAFEDALRPGVTQAVRRLQASGLAITVLSGDAPAPVRDVAARLGIDWQAQLTPEDKVACITRRRAPAGDPPSAGRRDRTVVAFVGDGLNDGPALAAADLGIAVGTATDAARAAAAVTLDPPGGVERLPELLTLTARMRRVMRQNLAWALAYNALALPAAAAGWVPPALAAVAMALSSISIVLNAARVRVPPRPPAAREATPAAPDTASAAGL